MRSTGKLAEVGAVPSGAWIELKSGAVCVACAVCSGGGVLCAQPAVASSNTNSPVFFMLPPEKTSTWRASPQLNARKERLQAEGNKRVREGQGYEGDGNPG